MVLKGEISACAQVEIRIILFLWMEPHEAVSLGSRIDVQRTTSIFTLFISLFEFLLMSCLLIQNNEVLGFPGGSSGKESACSAEHQGLIPGLGRSLEKEMATHSNILAWRISWIEKPGKLQSMGSPKSGTSWVTFTFTNEVLDVLGILSSSSTSQCAHQLSPAAMVPNLCSFPVCTVRRVPKPLFSRWVCPMEAPKAN